MEMALSSNANPLLPILSRTSIPSNYANRNLKSFPDFHNPNFIPKFSAKKPLFICNSRQPFSLRIRAQASSDSNVNVNEDQFSDFIIEDVPHLTNFLPDLPSYPNPLKKSQAYAIVKKTFVSPEDMVAQKIVVQKESHRGVHFRRAGPREKVYFTSEEVRACIVTCGGLCPGINTVLREIVCGLNYMYGVDDILGIQGGYRGFYSKNTIKLTPKVVNDIHKRGGTFLQTSRGGHDTNKIVDNIQDRGINQVYIIGGDGTQKGAAAIYKEVEKRGLRVAVAGIPKTIDNDIAVIDKSFGFDTAVEEAQRAINAAHVEVESVENGVGIVKLMGRYSGFIAMHATLASRDVDCCLIPEAPFYLEGQGGLFEFIEQRLKENGHIVIVLAEGAGQDYVAQSMHAVDEKDASGNRLLLDSGLWLTQKIKDHFTNVQKMAINMKYIDPTYMIRAIPSNASDNIYCTLLAQSAVHGAMAGYTGFTVGPVNSRHAYIPISCVTETQNTVKLTDRMWARLLASTNQPSFVQKCELVQERVNKQTIDQINNMRITSI
ncbi:ATP-dependent 6-phosphofructokinase 4, chloroplastic [Olea europaea var. sylvestris]|uniref:ATP-dependent 6-phosphofructokinase 4, chloroplastic n=1 Tax=Olea europaea var. sylvestris TaxID=158386 RepID=UPI000C1CED87|nr:ATP-dependent 6-phosphofructokinase 4, chloroplastic [Olea europaea var. sylvestris]